MRNCLLVILVFGGITLLAGEAQAPPPANVEAPAAAAERRIQALEKDLAVLKARLEARQEANTDWIHWLRTAFPAVVGLLLLIGFARAELSMRRFVRNETVTQTTKATRELKGQLSGWQGEVDREFRKYWVTQASEVMRRIDILVLDLHRFFTYAPANRSMAMMLWSLHAAGAADRLGNGALACSFLAGAHHAVEDLHWEALDRVKGQIDSSLNELTHPACLSRADRLRELLTKKIEERLEPEIPVVEGPPPRSD